MKLTEKDIFLSDGDVGREYLSINIHQSQSEFDNLKQQILEDHKIVDELKKILSVVIPYDISDPNDPDFIRYDYVRSVVKNSIGKDIQEIHIQENVEEIK